MADPETELRDVAREALEKHENIDDARDLFMMSPVFSAAIDTGRISLADATQIFKEEVRNRQEKKGKETEANIRSIAEMALERYSLGYVPDAHDHFFKLPEVISAINSGKITLQDANKIFAEEEKKWEVKKKAEPTELMEKIGQEAKKALESTRGTKAFYSFLDSPLVHDAIASERITEEEAANIFVREEDVFLEERRKATEKEYEPLLSEPPRKVSKAGERTLRWSAQQWEEGKEWTQKKREEWRRRREERRKQRGEIRKQLEEKARLKRKELEGVRIVGDYPFGRGIRVFTKPPTPEEKIKEEIKEVMLEEAPPKSEIDKAEEEISNLEKEMDTFLNKMPLMRSEEAMTYIAEFKEKIYALADRLEELEAKKVSA